MPRSYEQEPNSPFTFESTRVEDGYDVPLLGKSLGRKWMEGLEGLILSEEPLYTAVKVRSFFLPPKGRDLREPIATEEYVEATPVSPGLIVMGQLHIAMATRLNSPEKPVIPGLYISDAHELQKTNLRAILPSANPLNKIILDMDQLASPLRLRHNIWQGTHSPEELYEKVSRQT